MSAERPVRGPSRVGQFFDPEPLVSGPEVGDVYLSDTRILKAVRGPDRPDRKVERPVVVVTTPTRTYPRAHVCVRESLKRGRPVPAGVPHPADLRLGLDAPGVWLAHVKSAPAGAFGGEGVEYRGQLPSEYLERVLAMVEAGAP